MPPIPKTKKIASLAKLLHRRFKGLPLPPERTVLEHLMYAALLENASFEQADAAYAVLENYFIDWNEIRVSTVRELADTLSMLPDSVAAGGRIRRSLQGVFEKTYMYDLEELRRKGKTLGQAIEFLRGVPGCSRFMVDYTIQVALGGHLIPLDEASFRVFRLLGLTQINKEGTQEEVPGLERAIPKKNGLNLFTQLHHFASLFFQTPESVDFRTFLKPIDVEVLNRAWVPPVLVASHPVSKSATKRPLPVVTLPFAPPDEDEFDEESVGTEAEFLPDDSLCRPNEHESPACANDSVPVTTVGGKKNKERKTPGSPKKPGPPVTKTIEPQPTPKQPPKQAVEKKSVTSLPVKKVNTKKESDKPKAPPVKEPPKPKQQKLPPPTKKASAPKPAKPSNPKPTGKPTKSSTRQLREKKPK